MRKTPNLKGEDLEALVDAEGDDDKTYTTMDSLRE